jgi:hypothetical protein
MKVYFSKNEPEMNGYVHISNSKMLDLLVEDSQVTEIIIDDTLSSVEFNELPNLFSLLCSKLRIGGSLVVYYTDFSLICPQYENGDLSIEEINELFAGKSCILNEDVVSSLISQNNIKVTKSGYNSRYQGYVVATR